MKSTYKWLLAVLLLSVLTIGLVSPVGAGENSSSDAGSSAVSIDSALENASDEQTVIVRLSERPEQAMETTSQDQQPAALEEHAEETQSAFEQFASGNPHVEIEEQFWITNAIVVTVDLDQIPLERLGMVDHVERIHEDKLVEITETESIDAGSTPLQDNSSVDTADSSYTWGLEAIGVPQTWEDFDNRGDGVKIAVLDSGVDGDHPDIDISGWKDFDSNPSTEPKDYGDHGTHVSGTVVGGNESGQAIGVAPDAELYHGAVLTLNDGRSGHTSDIIRGIEWSVEENVDVVSLSLGSDGYNTLYIDPIRNARHSGTIPVSSSGNDGPETSSSPGNIYDSVAVGATADPWFGDEEVASFSSGETVETSSAWDSSAPSDWPATYAVPDVSAPGDGVLSTVPDADYDTKSGTSMAAPHVSGAIAVMLSNGDNDLTPDEIQTKLESTSLDLNEEETRQGAGRIDLYNATLANSRNTFSATITTEEAPILVPTEIAVEVNHPIRYYHWEFEDGTTVTTSNETVEHTFETKQTETVTVTLEDPAGENNTISTEIDVIDDIPPTARLTTNQSADVEVGIDTVEFNASESTSNSEISQYEWDFDDGATVETDSPTVTHQYETIGAKNPSVTVVDTAGNTNTTDLDIDVVDTTPPNPEITAPETIPLDSEVELSAANSTDNHEIANYSWEFDDGTTKTGQDITYKFTEHGTETITLTVTDEAGNTNSTSTDITVEVVPDISVTSPADESYVTTDTVSIEYTLANTIADDVAGVEYRIITDPEEEPVTDWTDGPFSSTTDPVSESISTTSLDNGNYTAEFRLVDPDEEPVTADSATDTVSFAVKTTPPSVELDIEPSVDDFERYGPNNPAVLTVTADDPLEGSAQLSISDTEGSSVAEWDLSDETGSGESTIVTWDTTDEDDSLVESGSYEVNLTADDGLGNENSITDEITVDTLPPNAEITAPETAITQSEVELSAANSTDNHGITNYSWEFDDGTTKTGQDITHEFTEDGTETVTLTVTDEAGNTDSTSTDITVQSGASVSITNPQNESYVATDIVSIEYTLSNTTADSISGVEYRIISDPEEEPVTDWTDGPFTSTTDPVSESISTTSLSDGNYTAEFRLIDPDDEPVTADSATDTVSFAVKTTPPTVDVDVEPSTDGYEQYGPNNPAILTVTADDPLESSTQLSITDDEGSTVADWDLSDETGSGDSTTVTWNTTDEDDSLVESGSYEVNLTADDGLGNENTATENITVDTDEPSVSIESIDGGTSHDGTIFINESSTVEITGSATDGQASADAVDELSLELASAATNYRIQPSVEASSEDDTTWTATFSGADIEDAGAYTLTATATDAANNTADSAPEEFEYDPTPPELSAVITGIEDGTASVQLRSSEPLAEEPTVTVTTPDESELNVDLEANSDRWTGEFDASDSGEYNLLADGIDLAGNQQSDTATATVDSGVTTINQTTTIYSESTGVFLKLHTDEELDNQTAALTGTDISPEALDPDQLGVQFLQGELGDTLNSQLTNATIGIPAESEKLPDGIDVDDDQVSISYYNASGVWEQQPTTVEYVEEFDGEYWTTTVDSFSSYGVTVSDTEPPELSDVSATADEDDDTVTITAEYTDDISGVDPSTVSLEIDGTDQTDNQSTSITSSQATHEGYPVGDGSYTVLVEIADVAGNTEVYEQTVSVDDDDDDGDNGNGGGSGGGGGSGAGGGGGGGGSTGASVVPTPIPDDVDTITREQARIDGGADVSVAEPGDFLTEPVVEMVIFNEPGLEGDIEVRDYSDVPARAGQPPGDVISANEIIVPQAFENIPATLRFNLMKLEDPQHELSELDRETLTVWHENDGDWTALDSEVIEDSEENLVVEAETDGFSAFAVTDTPEIDDEQTQTDAETEDEEVDDEIPGFGFIAAIIALVSLVVGVRLRASEH